MKKVSAFDVLKEMSERDLDLNLAPMGNLIGVNKVKGGFEVKIGVPDNIGFRLLNNEQFNGGLILANSEEFRTIEKELQDSSSPSSDRE